MKFINIFGTTITTIAFILAIYWRYEERIALQYIAFSLSLATALSLILLKIFYKKSNDKLNQEIILEGEQKIAIGISREYEIFYKTPFVRKPYLVAKMVDGTMDFEMVEQRMDGFKIRTMANSSSSYNNNLHLKWAASGKFIDDSFGATGSWKIEPSDTKGASFNSAKYLGYKVTNYSIGLEIISVVEGEIDIDTITWQTQKKLPLFKQPPEIKIYRSSGKFRNIPEIVATEDSFIARIYNTDDAGIWQWQAKGELLEVIED